MGADESEPCRPAALSTTSPDLCLFHALLTLEHVLALVSLCAFPGPALESAVSLEALIPCSGERYLEAKI